MSFPLRDVSTVEEFLENEAFQAWMTGRHPQDRLQWEEWLIENPEKRYLFEQAVATFLVIQGKQKDLSDGQVKDKARQILENIPPSPTIVRPLGGWRWMRWVAAAAIVSLAVWWQLDDTRQKLPLLASDSEEQQQVRQEWEHVRNMTDKPVCVLLPDNSSAVLSKGSQLRFRKETNTAIREVFLQGEAFFEVVKNPTRPFMVYTSNLTTKVLGTSFQVRSFTGEATAYVKVKTGRVSVTPVASPHKPMLLTVNQQLKLSVKAKKNTNEALKPVAAEALTIVGQEFEFEFTPVPEVFDRLEAAYYVPIQYDREVLRNCTFTGQLNGLPFLEKLKLICLATESTFEMVGNQVLIRSNGCN